MQQEVPKQYLEIAGATLLEHSLQALLRCEAIRQIVVPLHPQDKHASNIPLLQNERIHCTVGGERRSDSVLAGLQALEPLADVQDWVLVHDAARPCVQQQDIERLIAAVTTSSIGGLLAEPVVDTVKKANAASRVEATLDRNQLWRAQTPQMFRYDQLCDALQKALAAGGDVTDESSAMELAGHPVQLVAGSSSNLKITVAEDLALASWYLSRSTT